MSNSNSAVLTLTTEGTGTDTAHSAISSLNASGTNIISAPLVLGGAAASTQTIRQASGGTLRLIGSLSNANPITLQFGSGTNGSGVIEVIGNNSSLTASISVTSGTLAIGNNSALGSGTIAVAGATTIRSDGATDRVLTNSITAGGTTTPSTFGSAGTGNLTFGALTLASSLITINNAQTTFSSMSGSTFTKSGTGALLITGNKTTGGGTTTINGGTVGVAGTFASGQIILGGTSGSGVLAINTSFTRSLGATSTTFNWATSASGGFAAYGSNATWGDVANNLTVNIGGGTALTWASTANFLADTKTLILGSTVSNGTVTFQNAIDLNGAARTVQVDQGATNLAGGSDAVLSGVLSSGIAGGALTKTGAGTLALSGNNSYAGGTSLTAGTLVLAHNSAAGTLGVTLSGSSASTLQINSGITVANNITFSNTNATVTRQVTAGGSYDVGTSGNLTSSIGGTNTTAKILAGTNSAGTTDTITMSFLNTAPGGTTNDAIRLSDVFTLSGVHIVSGSTTDQFVLELNASTVTPTSFIGWLNGSNTWVNAVSGNTGGTPTFYTGAYAGQGLGSYGVDAGTNNVWAVLNHNSDFAVVPEPATWALLAFSLTTVMVLRRRKDSEGA